MNSNKNEKGPRHFSKDSKPKNDSISQKREFKKRNKNSRLKRSELIAQKEKMKMTHKFNKMMRKENKQTNHSFKLTNSNKKFTEFNKTKIEKLELVKTDENVEKNNEINPSDDDDEKSKKEIKKNPKIFTSYKKAQLEYENKQKQKEKEKEVRMILGLILNIYSL
jgi:hypothetical protein